MPMCFGEGRNTNWTGDCRGGKRPFLLCIDTVATTIFSLLPTDLAIGKGTEANYLWRLQGRLWRRF